MLTLRATQRQRRGMNVAGRCSESIPRFQASSLSGQGFQWLLPESWDDARRAAAWALCRNSASALYTSTVYVDRRRRDGPVTVGRWLLVRDHGAQVEALAEATLMPGHFGRLHVVVHVGEETRQQGIPAAAMAQMITALFLITGADLLELVVADRAVPDDLVGLGTVISPLTFRMDGAGLPVIARQPLLRVAAADWWASAPGGETRRTLRWLETRIQHEAEKNRPRSRKRRGLFDVLNGLLRWR